MAALEGTPPEAAPKETNATPETPHPYKYQIFPSSLKLANVRASAWAKMNVAARPGLVTLIVTLVLCNSGQTYLVGTSLGVIFGQLIAGMAKSTGQAVLGGIVFAFNCFWTLLLGVPIAYGFAQASPQLSRGLAPPVMFLSAFLLNFSIPAINIGALFVCIADAVILGPVGMWPAWYPMQLLLTILVGLAFAPVIHSLPLPFPKSDCCYLRPSSDALTGLDQVQHARELAAALLCQLAHVAEAPDRSLVPAQHLEARLRECVAQLKKIMPTALLELKLVCRKQDATRFSVWVARLDRQLPYLTLLTNIAVEATAFLAASPVACASLQRNRPLMLALSDALLTDTPDGSVPSLADAVAAMQAGHLAARTELLDAFVTEQTGGTDTGSAYENTYVRAPLLSHATLHALYALCAAAEGAADEDAARLQLMPPDATPPNTLKKLQTIGLLPPPLDFTTFGIRRALVFAISMGIAMLWVTEPTLSAASSGHGSWVGITVGVLGLQSDANEAVAKAGNRLSGTLIGAGFGIVMLHTTAVDYDTAWILCLSLWVAVCYFYDPSGFNSYKAQVSAFTATIFVLQPNSPTPEQQEQNANVLIVNRIACVIYGCVIYTVVQMLLLPLDSRQLLRTEIYRFLPLAQKCLEAAQAILSAETATAPDALATLRNAIHALRTSAAAARAKYTTASHAVDFGLEPPFQSQPVGTAVTAQTDAALALDMLTANLAHALELLADAKSSLKQRFVKLMHATVDLVLQQAALCAEQQAALVALQSNGDTPARDSLYEALRQFRSFRAVRGEILRVYVDLVAEEQRTMGPEMIDPKLMGCIALAEYALLAFCESMIKLGAANEQVAAGHPLMESTALLRPAAASDAPAGATVVVSSTDRV